MTAETNRLAGSSEEVLYQIFCSYKSWLSAKPFSANTRRRYIAAVNHFLGYVVAYEDFRAWFLNDERCIAAAISSYTKALLEEAGLRPSSINATLAGLTNFIEFVSGNRPRLSRIAAIDFAPPAALDESQQENLLEQLGRLKHRDQAIVLLFLQGGLKVTEALVLRVEDVSVRSMTGSINVSSRQGDRMLITTESLRNVLQAWLCRRAVMFDLPNSGPLFVNRFGTQISAQGIDLILRKIGRSLGMKISAKILRDTYISNHIKLGVDLKTMGDMLGLRCSEALSRYLPQGQEPAVSAAADSSLLMPALSTGPHTLEAAT